MSEASIEIIRQNSRPLDPLPTGMAAKTDSMPGIRAVLFDVYGTLFISGSGDVGTADEEKHETAFREALNTVGLELPAGSSYSHLLQEEIHRSHAESQAEGIEFPEVEIREVWGRVLERLADENALAGADVSPSLIEQLSLEYEVRANPVWPMPGCRECLEELKSRGLALGIISNAQFYTPPLFEALLGDGLDALGFHPELRFFSFESKRAKPGLFLYDLAEGQLANLGIWPEEVCYVGNDMLKDMYPADQVGFRTALFAGDARSLRLRGNDERTSGLKPDWILTGLAQLPKCLIR
jgi:putative hydrolase of the HAD superfamily